MGAEGADDDLPEIDITQQIGEVPAGFETTGQLFEALDRFHEARSAFLASCCAFADSPTEENRQDLGLTGSMVLRSFQISVDTMTASEQDEDTRIRMLANLVVSDDAERVELFRGLTHSGIFKSLAESGIETNHTLEDELRLRVSELGIETLPDLAKGAFFKSLQADVDEFIEQAVENYKPAPEDRKRLIARAVGKHALDVAKIAAGTALALWVMRRRE